MAQAENGALQQQLEPLLISEHTMIGGEVVHAKELVSAAYFANQLELIWTDRDYAREVLDLVGDAALEGLTPDDYHHGTLAGLYNLLGQSADGPAQSGLHAQFDILLTDAVMTYATHLIRGKVNPKSFTSTWNYELSDLSPVKAAQDLLLHVRQQTLAEGLESLKPQLPQYLGLKQALAFYRQLVPLEHPTVITLDSSVLRPGESARSVPLIRHKLALQGLHPGDSDTSNLNYDPEMVDGIRTLQRQNGLADDGIIGAQTLSVLNRTFAQTVELIRINLERIRWVDNSLTDQFIVVNIAGFKLFLYQHGQLTWQTNVIVGRHYTRTPIFKEKLRYVVINPTWTVPRSISKNIIRNARLDVNYLAEKDFYLVDNRRNPVDITSIDWDNVEQDNFPYWFVQGPSENNSLGQIKFMFPNKYAIYLHDTPAKTLFNSNQRAFSHGCVRVEQPFVLAGHVLEQNELQMADIYQVLESQQTEEVVLNEPIDIFLMYWTAMTGEQGLRFFSDVYERDPQLLARLNQPLTALAEQGTP